MLAACGGGGDGGDDRADAGEVSPTDRADQADESRDGRDGGDGSAAAVQPPEFLLTGDVEAPDGWVLDPANCASSDESGPPYFTYYVPEEWNRTSSGYGGSGGVSGSGTHDYELSDGPTIEIEIATDSYLDAKPVASDGSPWTSWDYEISTYRDDETVVTQVVYEELDPVEIDGETFDLWYLDESQDDQISWSEYKLRVVFADVPSGAVANNGRRPESATVTFSWSSEDGTPDEALIRDVLGTFRLDPCAQEGITELQETLHGVTW